MITWSLLINFFFTHHYAQKSRGGPAPPSIFMRNGQVCIVLWHQIFVASNQFEHWKLFDFHIGWSNLHASYFLGIHIFPYFFEEHHFPFWQEEVRNFQRLAKLCPHSIPTIPRLLWNNKWKLRFNYRTAIVLSTGINVHAELLAFAAWRYGTFSS